MLVDCLLGRPTVTADVRVIVAASTLAGADDQPGHLDGYGAITATHARRLAHNPTSTWARMLVGFGGLGAALRRRRGAVEVAA